MIYNYNLAKGRLVSDTGAVLSDRPLIRFATRPTWTIRFCDVSAGAVTALDVSDAVAWRAAVDRDHSTATEPMCRTLNDNVDQSAAAIGEISVPLDANTETFLTAVDGKESLSSWFELWGLDAAGEAIYYVKFPIWTGMPIDPASGEAPAAPTEQWADKTYLDARLAAGYEIELSDDGLTWYALEIDGEGAPVMPDTAAWWHYRHRLAAGVWSDPIPLLRGATGDPGTDGDTPEIGQNGNWYIGGVDTGVPATGATGDPGEPGADGDTPEIGPNGNWFIGGIDTGVPATGEIPPVDTVPTENSENLITSGAVYAALGDLQSILETL